MASLTIKICLIAGALVATAIVPVVAQTPLKIPDGSTGQPISQEDSENAEIMEYISQFAPTVTAAPSSQYLEASSELAELFSTWRQAQSVSEALDHLSAVGGRSWPTALAAEAVIEGHMTALPSVMVAKVSSILGDVPYASAALDYASKDMQHQEGLMRAAEHIVTKAFNVPAPTEYAWLHSSNGISNSAAASTSTSTSTTTTTTTNKLVIKTSDQRSYSSTIKPTFMPNAALTTVIPTLVSRTPSSTTNVKTASMTAGVQPLAVADSSVLLTAAGVAMGALGLAAL